MRRGGRSCHSGKGGLSRSKAAERDKRQSSSVWVLHLILGILFPHDIHLLAAFLFCLPARLLPRSEGFHTPWE